MVLGTSAVLLSAGSYSLATQHSVLRAEAKENTKKQQQLLAFRKKWEETMKQLQSNVCTAIEKVDGKAKFKLDEWTRKEGGGGWTKVLMEGDGK